MLTFINSIIDDGSVLEMVVRVELYEHEVWTARRGWIADDHWWRSREGAAAASTRETFPAPRGYAWDGAWRLGVVEGRNGSPLKQGWEYATAPERFEGRAPRGPRGVDFARRRRWTRPAKPARRTSKNTARRPAAPRVQAGLDTVRRARLKLADRAKQCGTELDSEFLRDALDALGVAVKKGAFEVTAALDAATTLDDGVVKKLRRDLHREVAAAADVLRNLPREPDEWPTAEEEVREFSRDSSEAIRARRSPLSDAAPGRARARVLSGSRPNSRREAVLFRPDGIIQLASGGRSLSSRRNHSAAQARASSRSHVVESGEGAFVFRPERAPSSATDGRYVARDADAALRMQAAADDDDAILSRFRSVSGSAVLDEILRERAAAIADIHASTLLLNEIARDLAGEVAAQQDHVDALEDNNARANAAITQGHAKLKEAQEHQHAGCVVC